MSGWLFAFTAALALVTPAMAQTASPPAPAAGPAKTAVPLTLDSPVEQIEADPRGKEIIARNLPRLTAHPAYDQVKGLSLRDIAPLSGGAITEEMLTKIAAELAAVK